LQKGHTSAKPTRGVWGHAPKKAIRPYSILLFPEKEAKSVVLLRRRAFQAISR
jgi:hypothetical protein